MLPLDQPAPHCPVVAVSKVKSLFKASHILQLPLLVQPIAWLSLAKVCTHFVDASIIWSRGGNCGAVQITIHVEGLALLSPGEYEHSSYFGVAEGRRGE